MTTPDAPTPFTQAGSRPSTAATVALIIGAAGSLALFFRAARNTPAILIFLYTGWVLLPFAALAFGRRRAARRAPALNATMQGLTLFVVAMSLTVYVSTALLAAPRPAAVFLMTPLLSWVVIALVFAVAMARARRPS